MGLPKTHSCLHFALQQEDLKQQCAPESQVERTTALHLPCGEPLRLPRRDSTPSDLNKYLLEHPKLARRARDFLQVDQQASLLSTSRFHTKRRLSIKEITESSTCLNVLQGEVAHVVDGKQETDVLLSGEATTCHVVAVRSTSTTASNVPPLTSLAHVDECNPKCLEKILLEHLDHHREESATLIPLNRMGSSAVLSSSYEDNGFGFFDVSEGGEDDYDENERLDRFIPTLAGSSPSELPRFPGFLDSATLSPRSPKRRFINDKIQIELHMAGGFDDSDGTSHQLSKELLEVWASLGEKYSSEVSIHLCTAAISGLNTDTDGPKARGLGIDTRTGEVFMVPCELPKHLDGPAVEIRNARSWARGMNCSSSDGGNNASDESSSKPELSVLHTRQNRPGEILIEPFEYHPQPQLNPLLNVPDQVLKQVVSTSPEHESERFCSDLRRTLSFINTVPSKSIFGGTDNPKPLVFRRRSASVGSSSVHEWEQHRSC